MPAHSNASPAAVAPAVEFRGLVKDFAVGLRGVKLRAVDHLDLRVAAGQIYGLLGPNGSGKSTSIKLLLGLLQPTAGGSTVFGVPSSRVESRREIGYLPEAPQFYRHLSGRELVSFYAQMCDLRGVKLQSRVADVLEWVGLSAAADRRVETYSRGMLQRVGLAQALVHDPRLLILDEPTAGVDPVGTAAIAELLLRLKREGKTILITSHLLAQMEEVCDRVAILDHGRLVIEGAVGELTGRRAQRSLLLDGLAPAELEELRAWMATRGHAWNETAGPGARLDQIFLARVGKTDSNHRVP
jgi:ABC-2 type transport system ATP-binding protein